MSNKNKDAAQEPLEREMEMCVSGRMMDALVSGSSSPTPPTPPRVHIRQGPMSGIRFSTFPRTQPPPPFVYSIIEVFRRHEPTISTLQLVKGLTSDAVLAQLRDDLVALGFDVEAGKRTAGKIKRPVFFGENGKPDLQYEIDAYSSSWRCGLEVEAGWATRCTATSSRRW